MRTLRLLTCCLLAGAAVSCTSPAAPAPTGDPSATGVIVARDMSISIGGPPTMHVKDPIEEECGVIYLLRSSTPVFHRTSDGRTTAASAADLTVGRRVGVWTDVRARLVPRPGRSESRRAPRVTLLAVAGGALEDSRPSRLGDGRAFFSGDGNPAHGHGLGVAAMPAYDVRNAAA